MTAVHAGIALLPMPVVCWCIACWDSYTSQACDWLCSHAWPCLIHAYPSVSNIPNLIITFVQGLAGNSS